MNTLAGVFSEVAAYEFTTLTTVPGVIKYKGAKIQLLDLPGIIEGAKDGKGRGRQVIAGNYISKFILKNKNISLAYYRAVSRSLFLTWSQCKVFHFILTM